MLPIEYTYTVTIPLSYKRWYTAILKLPFDYYRLNCYTYVNNNEGR